MRYPPLMIALFLWMTVRPFAQHFEIAVRRAAVQQQPSTGGSHGRGDLGTVRRPPTDAPMVQDRFVPMTRPPAEVTRGTPAQPIGWARSGRPSGAASGLHGRGPGTIRSPVT